MCHTAKDCRVNHDMSGCVKVDETFGVDYQCNATNERSKTTLIKQVSLIITDTTIRSICKYYVM